MARRRKTTGAGELIDLVGMLPCWAGVVLAVVFYVVLHRMAMQQIVPTVQPGQAATMVVQSFWRGLAAIGQYIVPLFCLAGAGVSAWKRRERKSLVESVVHSNCDDALDGMSWQQFEQLVGEAFRLQGYSVSETGGGGADGGVDIVLRKGSEKFLVQCKQWRAFKVGVKEVRELYGVMAAKGAAGGFVVSSGRFTEEATSFASGLNVTLVDGPKLNELIQQAIAARRAGTATSVPSPMHTSTPTCPLCSKQMAKRMARRGANAGGEFWGCTGYPACKGKRAVS
jgi:restriction system protein